jgi:hypothetical protein
MEWENGFSAHYYSSAFLENHMGLPVLYFDSLWPFVRIQAIYIEPGKDEEYLKA